MLENTASLQKIRMRIVDKDKGKCEILLNFLLGNRGKERGRLCSRGKVRICERCVTDFKLSAERISMRVTRYGISHDEEKSVIVFSEN